MKRCPPPAFNKRKRCKGFNLIEAAIVLGVVGLVIGGIWVAASAVNQKTRVRQIFDGVMFIAQRVNDVYGRGPITPIGMNMLTYRGIWKTPATGETVYPQTLLVLDAVPAGWSVKSNILYGPNTRVTPFLGVWADSGANELGWSVDIPMVFTNQSDCKAFGALALSSLEGGTIVYAGVGGTGGNYAEAQLNNGAWKWYRNGGLTGNGLPDPLIASKVTGCNSANIIVSRP